MELRVIDSQGQAAGTLSASDALFGRDYNEPLIHQIVTGFLANARQGTRAQKGRSEINKSTKKPWRQKGTGRARAGSYASPLWPGGGVTFGPKPRDHDKKVNKKVRQLALRKALGERLKAGDVIVVDDLKLSAPKTKEFVSVVRNLGCDGTALFVIGGVDANVERASRNVVGIDLTTGARLNTYDVLKYDKLVFTKGAFEQVEARLVKPARAGKANP